MKTYTDLNTNEIEVLKAISIASEANGGDFTYFDEVMVVVKMIRMYPLDEKQVKGYVSQLKQKQYIITSKEGKHTQICSGMYVDFLTEYEF
jgi:hypothetical protein